VDILQLGTGTEYFAVQEVLPFSVLPFGSPWVEDACERLDWRESHFIEASPFVVARFLNGKRWFGGLAPHQEDMKVRVWLGWRIRSANFAFQFRKKFIDILLHLIFAFGGEVVVALVHQLLQLLGFFDKIQIGNHFVTDGFLTTNVFLHEPLQAW